VGLGEVLIAGGALEPPLGIQLPDACGGGLLKVNEQVPVGGTLFVPLQEAVLKRSTTPNAPKKIAFIQNLQCS